MKEWEWAQLVQNKWDREEDMKLSRPSLALVIMSTRSAQVGSLMSFNGPGSTSVPSLLLQHLPDRNPEADIPKRINTFDHEISCFFDGPIGVHQFQGL